MNEKIKAYTDFVQRCIESPWITVSLLLFVDDIGSCLLKFVFWLLTKNCSSMYYSRKDDDMVCHLPSIGSWKQCPQYSIHSKKKSTKPNVHWIDYFSIQRLNLSHKITIFLAANLTIVIILTAVIITRSLLNMAMRMVNQRAMKILVRVKAIPKVKVWSRWRIWVCYSNFYTPGLWFCISPFLFSYTNSYYGSIDYLQIMKSLLLKLMESCKWCLEVRSQAK